MLVSEHPTPYNGTIFTLTGVVHLDQSVDTDILVSGVWSSSDGSQETKAPPYPTNLTFQPLTSDSSGEYTLTVSVRPLDNSPFIVGNNGSTTYNLEVQCKLGVHIIISLHSCVHNSALPSHPPTITVVSRHPSPDADGCGEVMILGCTADSVANLFILPTITWIAPDGREVPTRESSNPRIDGQTRQLIFRDIATTNVGSYMCHAVVNIPEAQIANYSDEATTTVSTNCGLLSLSPCSISI